MKWVISVSKLMKTMVTSCFIMVILGVTTFLIVDNVKSNPIDDLVKYSYETPEITTDIQGGSFVRIQFQIVTDGKKAVNEISKRDFQLQNILIKELAHLTEAEFTTELSGLEKNVEKKLNKLMTEGTITDVYTVKKILQ